MLFSPVASAEIYKYYDARYRQIKGKMLKDIKRLYQMKQMR
jgi:hypothetical protein